MDNIESEDEDPIGDAIAGSTSSASRMTTTPTPAPPSTPLHTPIPRGAQEPLAEPQPANACSTCVDLGILCKPNPGYSCFTCWSCKKKCEQSGTTRGQSASRARQPTQPRSADTRSQRGTPAISRAPSEVPAPRSRRPSRAASSKRGTSVNTQPPANTQDCPNVASSSTGIILRIPPSRATPATTIRMESAPQPSAVTAPVNMGLIPGTAYSIGGNPLVSHEEHRAALQRLETVEGENHELRGLITRALDHIEVLDSLQMSSADGPPIPAPLTEDPAIPAPLMDDPPIPPPVSPAMSIPPVEVLAETESASDNGGSGDNNGSGENDGSGGSD
ncbi:hypothetical protein PAXINDRAFT_18188 [Paxillus involutus ATCC 200175]|uniref:Uncharacterized protein n=1 Tax=Paxillus involutus ATCC 200175 TaxID=664439 RepID=A0A0C9TCG8_PAXIN|nr:hypothetical protein PAXINDRAFT_18188 [Paxillus involutus ATCC 200175]